MLVEAKKTSAARSGATTEPTAWTDCDSSSRNSDSLGGPQVAMNGLAEVSRVDRPEPTMNREPQKPPNDL